MAPNAAPVQQVTSMGQPDRTPPQMSPSVRPGRMGPAETASAVELYYAVKGLSVHSRSRRRVWGRVFPFTQ